MGTYDTQVWLLNIRQIFFILILIGSAFETGHIYFCIYLHCTLGTKRCPESIPLWTLLADLELGEKNTTKARSVIEKARLRYETFR
jgi:hypothetical protein